MRANYAPKIGIAPNPETFEPGHLVVTADHRQGKVRMRVGDDFEVLISVDEALKLVVTTIGACKRLRERGDGT
jgi:hypothetical protein